MDVESDIRNLCFKKKEIKQKQTNKRNRVVSFSKESDSVKKLPRERNPESGYWHVILETLVECPTLKRYLQTIK